jgi:hypothetical protein
VGKSGQDRGRLYAAWEGALTVKAAWELEQEARAINATAWEPLPGTVKRRCPRCAYFFAAPADGQEPRCPDCVRSGSPPRVRT